MVHEFFLLKYSIWDLCDKKQTPNELNVNMNVSPSLWRGKHISVSFHLTIGYGLARNRNIVITDYDEISYINCVLIWIELFQTNNTKPVFVDFQ